MKLTRNYGDTLLLAGIAYILFRSIQAFQKIAWGTGMWWGEYSLKWGVAYGFYIIFCLSILIFTGITIWRLEKFQPLFNALISVRERLNIIRWVLAVLIAILPIWILQYTPWGVVFHDIYIRLLMWGLVITWLAFQVKKGNALAGWQEYISATLLTCGLFVIAIPFMNVTSYPFSLGWSEGNRMWDFSILFGRHLYDYPADQEIPVLLDIGRQFVGGLPFIFPGVTIWMERFWIALTVILPYLLLGFAAFRFLRFNTIAWLFATLWVLIFLKQGPIHPPLVICAFATALAWRSPLWFAIPIIAAASYFAGASRFTWVFAPGLWIGMLELAGATLNNNKLTRTTWVRTITLGLTGFVGGQYGESIISLFKSQPQLSSVSASISVDSAVSMVTTPEQPLLWYRLMPNETYPLGVLFGLIMATLPLILLLGYLIISGRWKLNFWQMFAILAPLTAFLVVGLIVSTKIGGGGDLHNMDMFLIGLMFVGVLAWDKTGKEWLDNLSLSPRWVKYTLILFFALPGLFPLGGMRSFSFTEDTAWLVVLTDSPNEKALDMIPSDEVVENALQIIQEEVDLAVAQGGEVLFSDQRQLLTFGFITNVPFVPEYEKKVLMNNALSSSADYFQRFYEDLANQRFALIISEPLRVSVQDRANRFGEENNAWVVWVTEPILCYYDIKTTLTEVNVQLLIPKPEPVDCSAILPVELP